MVPPVIPYLRPNSLAEALAFLATGAARVLAGGTDLYPATGAQSLPFPVVDLAGLPDLSGLTHTPEGLRLGAAISWSALARADLPPALRALQQAARQVGGWQVQNAGTLGGNLCNASPAADGVPPLLILDAQVELAAQSGPRRLPLADFLIGPRRTALAPGEILTALHIPPARLSGGSAFHKLGARAYLVISIAMVAARVTVAQGRLTSAALAIGACAPTARRLPALEAALVGLTLPEALARLTPATLAPHLAPLDDIRASATYRLEAAAELARRALSEAAG